MSEAGPDATHHRVRLTARRTGQQSGLPEREGELPVIVIGELMSGGLLSHRRNQQRGMPLTVPLISMLISWGLGQVHRKVSHVSGYQ